MVCAPGACDAFTARLIERSGFPAVYLGGNALGLSLGKGQPLVTLTETVEYASRLVRATATPVVVDAGAGFGGPAHVAQAVRELEGAGVAALHIDDQPYPKSVNYHRGSGGLARADYAARRIAAACDARRDPELLVLARTDVLRVTGDLDQVVDRGRSYAAAGADGLIVLDLALEQVAALREALPHLPLVWLGGVPDPAPPIDALRAAGFALALYPFNTVAAIAQAVGDLWRATAETGVPPQDGAFLVRQRRELAEIAGLGDAWALEDRLAGEAP
jgi:2-methylisocitrate lyase-like PEP mutase family enzyme